MPGKWARVPSHSSEGSGEGGDEVLNRSWAFVEAREVLDKRQYMVGVWLSVGAPVGDQEAHKKLEGSDVGLLRAWPVSAALGGGGLMEQSIIRRIYK